MCVYMETIILNIPKVKFHHLLKELHTLYVKGVSKHFEVDCPDWHWYSETPKDDDSNLLKAASIDSDRDKHICQMQVSFFHSQSITNISIKGLMEYLIFQHGIPHSIISEKRTHFTQAGCMTQAFTPSWEG